MPAPSRLATYLALACNGGARGQRRLPEPATLCYRVGTDERALTPEIDDDLSDFCSEVGANAELFLVNTGGTRVQVTFDPRTAAEPMVRGPNLG